MTGQPLFNEASLSKAKNVLKNIHLSYYLDPLGIKLYSLQCEDKYGLPIYCCIQGTNGIEVGVHQNTVNCFGTYCASPSSGKYKIDE